LNCDDGQKWTSAGPSVCEMKKCCIVSRRTRIGTIKRRKVKWTVILRVRTAF